MGQVPEGPPVLGETWRCPILPSPILTHSLSQVPRSWHLPRGSLLLRQGTRDPEE